MRIVAIDQSTTSTRAVVFGPDAPPHLAASLRHRQYYPASGWVEHDPREILDNVRACLAAAGDCDGIGIANQGESCLAWDAITLEPLSPIIVWQDNRTTDVIERLKLNGLEPSAMARSGLPLDSYFSASKLAWLIHHNPDVAAALKAGRLRLGTTDTFLLEHLTGVHATDPTTASRTGLMNIATLTWDATLCEMFDVPIDVLAPIRATAGFFGYVEGRPVRASVVDQQAALFGHGCRRPGDAKITFGTGAFALVLAGETVPIPKGDGLISTVAWQTGSETRYALEGGVYDAGAAVEWAIRVGLVGEPAELQSFSKTPAIGRGLAFVPALSGLACPQWHRGASGLWIGMSTATTRRDLQQAILEGVALQTREVIETLDKNVGLGDVLLVDGGLSASDYFLTFLAIITEKTVVRSVNTELTSYGCALLAGFDPTNAPATAMETVPYAPQSVVERHGWIDRYRNACAHAVGWNG